MTTKTTQPKVTRKTTVIDADGKVLGRIAAVAVKILMGKHRVDYSMHQDTGDYVEIKNVKLMKITGGNKMVQKEYLHFSQYPGGLKRSTLIDEMEKNPARVLRRAVVRMLPRNRLRDVRAHRLLIEGESKNKRLW
jgi:large subunit ribosomal protein L13